MMKTNWSRKLSHLAVAILILCTAQGSSADDKVLSFTMESERRFSVRSGEYRLQEVLALLSEQGFNVRSGRLSDPVRQRTAPLELDDANFWKSISVICQNFRLRLGAARGFDSYFLADKDRFLKNSYVIDGDAFISDHLMIHASTSPSGCDLRVFRAPDTALKPLFVSNWKFVGGPRNGDRIVEDHFLDSRRLVSIPIQPEIKKQTVSGEIWLLARGRKFGIPLNRGREFVLEGVGILNCKGGRLVDSVKPGWFARHSSADIRDANGRTFPIWTADLNRGTRPSYDLETLDTMLLRTRKKLDIEKWRALVAQTAKYPLIHGIDPPLNMSDRMLLNTYVQPIENDLRLTVVGGSLPSGKPPLAWVSKIYAKSVSFTIDLKPLAVDSH